MKRLVIILTTCVIVSACATGPDCCCALYSVNGNFLIGETMNAKSCANYSTGQRRGQCVDPGVCEVKVEEGVITN